MIDLVRKRHEGDGWIVFQELGNVPGYPRSRADAFALGVWASHKYECHLYEFKISREDVKRELRDPTKAEGVGKYCHYWWMTISDESVIRDLVIPDAWGILIKTKRGGSELLKVHRKAPKLKPVPFSPQFAVSAIRNIRNEYIEPSKHNALVEELDRIKHGPPATDEEIEQGRTRFDLERKLSALEKKVKDFEERSGVTFTEDWRWGNIGDAVKYAMEHRDLIGDTLVRNNVVMLSGIAEQLEDAARRIAEKAVSLRSLSPGVSQHREGCQKPQWHAMTCRCGAEPMSDIETQLLAESKETECAS